MSSFENENENVNVNVNVNVNLNNDDKIESRAPFDEYSVFEFEHDRQLNIIYNFKQHISKEPEFCGIFWLSSYVILDAFNNSKNFSSKFVVLTKNQLKAFKSTYYDLYKLYPEDTYLDKIGLNLLNKIYV
jgi:hypothetical protein